MTISSGHYLYNLSSLSRYFGKDLPGFSFELIEGSIVDIAKVVDNIRYPGVEGIDAACTVNNTEHVFRCTDSIKCFPVHPLDVLNLLYDKNRGYYIDRAECYRSIRMLEVGLTDESSNNRRYVENISILTLLETAALISCFGFKPRQELLEAFSTLSDETTSVLPAFQRLYLTAILAGDYPAAGLKLLKDFGAVEALWPELDALCGLDQAKEYHPEGDVWDHSLETLFHRKTNDPDLSLALLLHDVGKPLAVSANGNRFNNHAQIGGAAAETFLKRLEFPRDRIEKICFLVENHMMPAAINSLPTFRTEKAMLNPYFPMLLEVYRCDLLSSFNGPEGYYEACNAYRCFLKNTKNPFRNSDGKKLLRMYVDPV